MTLISGCNEKSNAQPIEKEQIEAVAPVAAIANTENTTMYKEGVHYAKVEGIVSEKDEVREYFSFYCPHCFRFEGFIDILKKELPKNIALEKNHVDFLAGASKKMQQGLTKALIVGQELNMEAQASAAIFNYIHVSHATPTSINDLRNIFVLMGVDGEKFDTLMNSEAVIKKAQQMQANQNALAKSKGITGVPAVIVNGKYRIINAGLDKNNFQQDYLKLIDYLVAL